MSRQRTPASCDVQRRRMLRESLGVSFLDFDAGALDPEPREISLR
jgi:hypothetical protein